MFHTRAQYRSIARIVSQSRQCDAVWRVCARSGERAAAGRGPPAGAAGPSPRWAGVPGTGLGNRIVELSCYHLFSTHAHAMLGRAGARLARRQRHAPSRRRARRFSVMHTCAQLASVWTTAMQCST